MDSINKIFKMTGIEELLNSPEIILMLFISLFILFLGIRKKYEPLLLVPIGFGLLLANLPGANLGVVDTQETNLLLQQEAQEYQQKLAKYNGELQSYQVESAASIQNYSAKIQKHTVDYQWLQGQYTQLLADYQKGIQLITRS